MNDEFDYEADSAREWLGIDFNQEMPLTIGDALWMVVQLAAVSAFVLGSVMIAGILTGNI